MMRSLHADVFMGLGFLVMCCAMALCAQCSAPSEARAQMAVFDPSNFGQNTVTALNSVAEVKNQVMQLKYQLDQIQIMYRDLKSLSVSDRAKIETSFYQLQSLSSRSQLIAMQWERSVQDFDRVYGKSAASKRRSEEQKKQQAQQTDQAYQDAMRSHAVIEKHGEREQEVQRLVSRSYDAEGTVQALQRMIELLAILQRQLEEFEQVMLLDSRARSSEAMEDRRRTQAADEAASDRMSDWPASRRRRANQTGELPKLTGQGRR